MHVIGSWGIERPGRVGLVLGVLLAVALHLVGTVHGAAFADPHVPAVPASSAPHPGHDHHSAEGHIDHTADRPRAAPADDQVPEADGPPDLAHHVFAVPSLGDSRSLHGSSAFLLHCVRRQ